ncbi:hypothetical protein PROFUN_00286 [Planoprotostelium fungivorum]|uniref:Uncharacterized protein n=1 Tax=Planoprotostelium fungivorum TaxID=1890364 RepID=A0A2P6NY25_9EUKA|nr:hypothetical protein PROFUN_00286 [Planoprotostelium fungivorum]
MSILAYLRDFALGVHKQHQQPMLKRQRVDTSLDVYSTEELAFRVLDSIDNAVLVMHYVSDSTILVAFMNDLARKMMSDVAGTDDAFDFSDPLPFPNEQSFWTSVRSVANTGIPTRIELKISNRSLRIKFKKILLNQRTFVAAIAKYEKERNPSDFAQHGPSDELTVLANSVENDIIGRVLGFKSLFLTLNSNMFEPGITTFYAVSPSVAFVCGLQSPHQARGKTTDVIKSDHLSEAAFNDLSQRSSFTLDSQVKHFTLFCEVKRITPKVYLTLCLVHRRKPPGVKPQPAASTTANSGNTPPSSWSKHQWDVVLEDCLVYISENPQYACTTKQKVPAAFFDNSQNIYCYFYQGESFLPSGSSDGLKWKSSCSAPTQGKLQKRYFYHKTPEGKKLRRRVMWLEDLPGFFALEYRHFSPSTSVELERLMGSDTMDWTMVISQVSKQDNHKLLNSMEELEREFKKGESRVETSEMEEPSQVLSYVSGILNNWAVQYHLDKSPTT